MGSWYSFASGFAGDVARSTFLVGNNALWRRIRSSGEALFFSSCKRAMAAATSTSELSAAKV
jgi:hypothetical protein